MKTMNFSEALRDHEDEAKALGTGLHDLSALVPLRAANKPTAILGRRLARQCGGSPTKQGQPINGNGTS